MIQVCSTCCLRFDDARRSCNCPHALIMAPEDLARKEAAIRLIGKRVRVKSEGEGSVPRLIMCVDWSGRITLYGRNGEFEPEQLEVVIEPAD